MISPQEAAKENDKMHADELKAAEKRVDKILAKDFYSGTRISIDAKLIHSNYQLRKKLIDRYRQAGWKVEYVSDQRDGDFCWFSA